RSVLLHVVEGLDRDAVERRLRLARKGTRIVDRLLECPAGLVGHVARRGGERRDEAEVVEGRGAHRSEDLARLADRATQERGRLLHRLTVHRRALELRVGGHEDWSKSIVQIARETPAVLLLLREELTGEVLQIAVELHPLH